MVEGLKHNILSISQLCNLIKRLCLNPLHAKIAYGDCTMIRFWVINNRVGFDETNTPLCMVEFPNRVIGIRCPIHDF